MKNSINEISTMDKPSTPITDKEQHTEELDIINLVTRVFSDCIKDFSKFKYLSNGFEYIID
jgi:hypothetical protein